MTGSAKALQAAIDYYEREWATFDQTLYELCRAHRSHADRNAVNAKVWLIGRGMTTRIEQHIRSDGSQGSSLTQLADLLYTRHADVDALIDTLPAGTALNLDALKTIIAAQGQLAHLVSAITVDGRLPHSFTAKYLHFHCSLVPIYDKYARDGVTVRYRWSRRHELIPRSEACDEEYYRFALRFWQLYQEAQQTRPGISVRHVDMFLMLP